MATGMTLKVLTSSDVLSSPDEQLWHYYECESISINKWSESFFWDSSTENSNSFHLPLWKCFMVLSLTKCISVINDKKVLEDE